MKHRNEDLVSGILCGTNELVNIIRADQFFWESRIGCTMTCLDPLDPGREAVLSVLVSFPEGLDSSQVVEDRPFVRRAVLQFSFEFP